MAKIETVNPATGARIEQDDRADKEDVEAALERAQGAYESWRERPLRERGERLAREVDAGCVYVNQLVQSDPRVPFGGVGDSGYGRELSAIGIQEFVNRKTVWVE